MSNITLDLKQVEALILSGHLTEALETLHTVEKEL